MLYRANFDTNKGSIRMCEKNGWRIVGKRENIGKNKFGLWQSTVIMEHRSKTVGEDLQANILNFNTMPAVTQKNNPKNGVVILCLIFKNQTSRTRMCTSSSCCSVTRLGAFIIKSWAAPLSGNAITSRIVSSSAKSITILSIPGAIPA